MKMVQVLNPCGYWEPKPLHEIKMWEVFSSVGSPVAYIAAGGSQTEKSYIVNAHELNIASDRIAQLCSALNQSELGEYFTLIVMRAFVGPAKTFYEMKEGA